MTSDFESDALNLGDGRFPPTRRSALALVGSDDPAEVARAFDVLVRVYWKPVYTHVRLRWGRAPEEARDLTQGFFASAFEKRAFGAFDPTRARFRTYLKGALDNFVLEAGRFERREKRGGGAIRLSLDFDVAEEALARSGPPNAAAIESCFEKEWTRSLFAAALEALEARCRAEGKNVHLTVFHRYVIDPEIAPEPDARRPSYAALATELGLSVTDVTNHLSWARRTFRELLLDTLREITANEEELRSEARAVFGIDP